MKRFLLLAATAAVALTPLAASAQRYDDHRGHRYDDRRDNDRYDRRDYRDGRHQYRYQRGQRYDHYRNQSYIISDYGRYGYRAPPRGYAYYRTDTGDVILAAIATGIITSIITGNSYQPGPPAYRYVPAPVYRYDQYGRPY